MANNQKANVVVPNIVLCGLCKSKCNFSKLGSHPCMAGYTNFLYEKESPYVFPVKDDGLTIVKDVQNKIHSAPSCSKALLENTNSKVTAQSSKRPVKNTEKGKISWNTDLQELLINEVYIREPLWNLSLPLEQRAPAAIKKYWQEVADSFSVESFTADEAKNKFKNLVDTFRRIAQAEVLPSGSERTNKVSQWAHYHSMQFMRESCLAKHTSTNARLSKMNSANKDGEIDENDVPVLPKRKRAKSEDSNILNRIADALCDSPSDQLVLPSPPPMPDEIDSFTATLGYQLRELPARHHRNVMRDLLNLIVDAVNNYNN